jgi:hypothetical protein
MTVIQAKTLKIGDKVKCIFKEYYNQYLEVGKIYTVEKIDISYSALYLKEINDQYHHPSNNREYCYNWEYFEKVHSLKDKLTLIKELLELN